MSGETFEKVSSTLGEQIRFSLVPRLCTIILNSGRACIISYVSMMRLEKSQNWDIYTFHFHSWYHSHEKRYNTCIPELREGGGVRMRLATGSLVPRLRGRREMRPGYEAKPLGTPSWDYGMSELKHGCNDSFLCDTIHSIKTALLRLCTIPRVPTICSDWRGCLRWANGRQGRSTHETKLLHTEKQLSCKHLINKMFTVAI